jgi:hypothetical protein
MSKLAIIEPHYWPGVAWWASYLKYAEVLNLDIHSYYLKQTFRNRCMVPGPNSVVNLTIPVKHNGGLKQALKDTLVDQSFLWRSNHKNTLKSVYGKAPYFEFYVDKVFELYNLKSDYLIDYQLKSIEIGLNMLKLKGMPSVTVKYIELGEPIIDHREQYSTVAKGGTLHKILSENKYRQVFGGSFIAGAGLPDVVFNLGPASLSYLKKLAEVLHPEN